MIEYLRQTLMTLGIDIVCELHGLQYLSRFLIVANDSDSKWSEVKEVLNINSTSKPVIGFLFSNSADGVCYEKSSLRMVENLYLETSSIYLASYESSMTRPP